MSKRTLLITSSYEVISFLNERRTFKLLAKDKVDAISHWDDTIRYGKETIYYPAILKMKYDIKLPYLTKTFSRKTLVRRDKSTCQYCSLKLSPAQVTIDHVIPKSKGGKTTFINCVVACQRCNNYKNDRTPDEAKMKLLREPTNPNPSSNFLDEKVDCWHEDWNSFIRS